MASFRIYNSTLCPDLWDVNKHLNAEIRSHLIQLATDFYEKTKFVAPIIDIWLMGSIANYNWTADSDVDVHIIIDFSQLQMPHETASKVAKTAGAQWNSEHEVTVKGHKVEINIQSVKAEKPYVKGIYSLSKDTWIREPQHLNVNVDHSVIQAKYGGMQKYVETAIASGNREEMKKAKDFLDAFRQYGLDNGGELSTENIVYKILRSKGMIGKLKDAITATYDKEMSVKEADNRSEPDNSFQLAMQFATSEMLKDPNLTAFGGGRSDARKVKDAYDINCGFCEEWSEIVRQKYKELTNRDDVEVLDPGNISGNDDDDSLMGHVFIRFNGKFYDAETPSGVPRWQDLPIFKKQGINEVTQKDINAHHPHPGMPTKQVGNNYQVPDLEKMTLGNLKALAQKCERAINYLVDHPEIEDRDQRYKVESDQFKLFKDEIKRRLGYINAPVTEGNDPHYNAAVDFGERKDRQMYEIAVFLKEHPKNVKVPWQTISASLLKRTWLQFGKYKRINVNAIDKIADQILTNIARLEVANEFQGHSDYDPREELSDNFGIEFTDDEWNDNVWRFETTNGLEFVSDYGIAPLKKMYSPIFNANTPEDKLYACDKALNIVHQRNDLAAMFVEGGISTLNAVADQGGYNSGYEYGDVNRELRNINEVFVYSFETHFGGRDAYVEVFKNPSPREMAECKPHHEVGAILTAKDIYVWDREKAYHKNAMDQLKLHRDLPLLLIPDNTNPNRFDILITDASKGTKWNHNPNTANFIRNHPFFKNKQIDHIMYWDEDVVGDWEELKNEPAVAEGIGWVHTKDINKDPLHIPGERWRIKWDANRKTPKMETEIINELVEQLLMKAPEMKTLKSHKVQLTDDERKTVMDADAVWHHGPNGEATPAVWKSVVKGKTWFVTNTHRLYQCKPSLKGAISAYHKVVKQTA